MKGTEKIIAHIQADAQAQADAILAQAGQQCAEIRGEYEAQAREAYAAKIREGVKACEDALESRKRITEMERKKEILALKQELVSAAFERAKQKLLSMSERDYAVFLTNLAVKAAPDGRGELVFNSADGKKYGKYVCDAANQILKGQLTVSSDTGDFSGGLIVRNGRIEVNSTVELLIELCRGELSSQVASILFA